MVVHAGHHRFGPEHGRIILHTFRDGLAAQAGHDLTIEVTRWSGELTVNEDLSPADLSVQLDLGSLAVREGSGGLKPLTDADRREIAFTARKTLGTDRNPSATFTASGFEPSGDGGVISGTLELAGQTRPVRLQVSPAAAGGFQATASVVQSQYGIKPYKAFLGALRVRDAVDVVAEVDLAAGEAP
jgi:polyisoprenoid-binding protein YceI